MSPRPTNGDGPHNGMRDDWTASDRIAPTANLASDIPLRRRVNLKTGEIELPPQNIDHIATLALSDEPDGRKKVIAYAERAVGNIHGAELLELRACSRHGHDNLNGIGKQIAELTKILTSTRRYNETDRQSEPWTWFDKLQIIALVLVSLILMCVGINSMATVLRESGIPAFENPYCRYLFSMIPLALPFAFKYLSRQCGTTKGRASYHTAIWLAGILFAIIWAFLFASTFNGITQDASELVSAMTLNPSGSQPENHKWLLMVVSILAESLLAAGCWLTIESIVEKHESSVRIPNPAYEHTQAELNRWRELESEEEEYLGKVDGRIRALEDAIGRYVADAEAIYVGKKYAAGSRGEVGRILDGQALAKRAKVTKLSVTLVTILFVSFNPAIAGQHFIFGVSPEYERHDKNLVFQKIVQFALEGANPGDTIAVYDALGLQPVTIMTIPEGALFRSNARARLTRIQKEVAVLKSFFLANTNPLPASMVGVINVPEFLALVSSHLRRSGERTVVALVGSPFYMDQDGNFSMNDAFPSDAHLAVDQRESVFGLATKKQALGAVTVHYAYLHECFVNDYHKERTGRFWCLLVGEQQGVLASFVSNLELVLRRIKDDVRQPFMTAKPDPNDTKVEMRYIAPRKVPAWFPQTNVVSPKPDANEPQQPVVPGPVTNAISVNQSREPDHAIGQEASHTNIQRIVSDIAPKVPPPAEVRTADPLPIPQPALDSGVGIGIMWNADGCDWDLHVRPHPNSKELCYRNRSTRDGRYFRDYRNRNDKLDFEYVELTPPVDIEKVKAFVNFYRGHVRPAKGIAVIRYGGKSFTAEFTLKASEGNFGRDSSNRSTSPHWVELDIASILGFSDH